MILTTFNGESVYLLPYRPNWADSPQARFSLVTDVTRSLGGRESRRAHGLTLRTRLNFSLLLKMEEQAAFRVALQRLEAKRVLCPFWPAAHLYASAGELVYTAPDGSFYTAPGGEVYVSGLQNGTPLSSGIWFTFERDYSAWEVHTLDVPAGFTPSATAIRVPLMLGIFDGEIDPKPITSTLLDCDIKFRETGPAAYALRPTETAHADGPAIVGGRTPKVFPLRPNWAKGVKAGRVARAITLEDIGYGRTPHTIYYPQAGERQLSFGFLLTSWDQVASAVSFFHQRLGNVESFWVDGASDEVTLSAPTSSASAVVSVANASLIGDNRFISFIAPGSVSVLRKILSVDAGANTLTLDASPGDLPASSRVVSLVLARFSKPELTISFKTDRVANTEIGFGETPTEYDTQPAETYATTHGALATPAYLFRFIRYHPGLTIINRYTSFERNIDAAGELFEAKKISHSEITEALEIEQTKIKIKSDAFEGNPLMLFMPNRLEGPLWVEVLRCTPDASGLAGLPETLFVGKVNRPRYEGPSVECEAVHQLMDLNQMMPTMLIQPTCNYRLYSNPCGILESANTYTGSTASSGTSIVISSGTFPDLPAGYFAFGRIWFGSGATYQSRTIFNSTAAVGGVVTLTIQGVFAPAIVGTVNLSPGCDGSADTCKNRFNNFNRFGGFPFVPPGNPSLVPVKKSDTPGGKK